MTPILSKAKDLRKEPPCSPRIRILGYVILARTLDKCRAILANTLGDYNFDCPLDNCLFSFKGIEGHAFKARVQKGGLDDEIAHWLDQTGIPKTPAEITRWSDTMEETYPYENPEKREWFAAECEQLGLDPIKTTLFHYLEANDDASFKTVDL